MLIVGTYTAFTPSIAFTSIPVRPDCRPCSKSYFRGLAGLLFGHLVYPTSIYKWDIHDLYSYTRPVRAMHNSYESALALCVLFYFLRLLYIYSNPYLIKDTHYRLINYITFKVLLYVTYSDYLAILTLISS
jgi:hypothetical protein